MAQSRQPLPSSCPQDLLNLLTHIRHRRRGIQSNKTMGRIICPLSVSRPNAAEKFGIKLLEAIRCAGPETTLCCDLGRQVEPQGQVWLKTGVNPALQGVQHIKGQAATTSLVGHTGIGETITQHGSALLERRCNHLLNMISPPRKHQQGFGEGVHAGTQQQAAKLLGQGCSTGLTCHQDFRATRTKPLCNILQVRRFTGTINALKGDESRVQKISFSRLTAVENT